MLTAKPTVVQVQAAHEEHEATRLSAEEAAAEAAAGGTAALDRWQAAETSRRRAVEASTKSAEALHKAQRTNAEDRRRTLTSRSTASPCAKNSVVLEAHGWFRDLRQVRLCFRSPSHGLHSLVPARTTALAVKAVGTRTTPANSSWNGFALVAHILVARGAGSRRQSVLISVQYQVLALSAEQVGLLQNKEWGLVARHQVLDWMFKRSLASRSS